MKALIIEDEKPAADKLIRMLHKIDTNITIFGPIETVTHGIDFLKNNRELDLVFMDIQLNDGICFEIFENIKVNTPVVFTTAYDEYAIKAFKVNSVDYLLKPIEIEALQSAVNKYKSIFQQRILDEGKWSRIYEDLAQSYKSRFFIKTGLHYKSIAVEDVECFYIRERGVFLRTFTGQKYDLDFSLEQIQQMVDPGMFFRINRNYIVNIIAIEDIHIYSTSRLKLKLVNKDMDDVIVSREKVTEFKKWMDR